MFFVLFTQNSQIARDKYTFAVYIINTKGGGKAAAAPRKHSCARDMIRRCMMQAACRRADHETTPLLGGSYKVTYLRNARGACVKEDATEEIIHYHDMHGTLVHCEYHKIKHN